MIEAANTAKSGIRRYTVYGKTTVLFTDEFSPMPLDWHSAPLSTDTPLDSQYKNTQNVRRFLTEQCGEQFTFNRDFMAWIRSGAPKTLGDLAVEWTARYGTR